MKLKNIIVIEDSVRNKISYYHLLFYLMALPFDRFYSELILISFCLHSLLGISTVALQMNDFKKILFLQSPFLISVVSIIYSTHFAEAINEIQIQLALFLFPLFFTINKLDYEKYFDHLMFGLVLTCLSCILYLEYDAIRIIRFNHLNFKEILSLKFINENFTAAIDLHPTYFGVYILTCIAFLLQMLIDNKRSFVTWFYLLAILMFSFALIQLAVKSILIAYVLILLMFPFFIHSQNQFKKILFGIAVLIMIMATSIFFSESLNIRIVRNLVADMSVQEAGKSKNEFRMMRWKAAFEVIKRKPIIGHGSGASDSLLQAEYFKEKLYNSYLNNLNTHNQYLSFWLKAGILGLVIYIAFVCWGIYSAITGKDFQMLVFYLLMAMVSLSENILELNKGVFFFGFFISLFFFRNKLKSYKTANL